jgi:hypothetical protein
MGSDGAAWLRLVRHLADARRALALGNLEHALTEVEAAVALDAGFVAALSLRAEIVARMGAVGAAPTHPAERTQNTHVEAQPRPAGAPASAARPLMTMATLVLIVLAAALGGMKWRSTHAALERIDAWPPTAAAKANVEHRAPSPPATVARAIRNDVAAEAPAEIATPKSVAAWTSPRLAQLDVRPRWRASAIHVEDSALLRDLEEGVSELWIGKLTTDCDAIFVGAADENNWDTLASFLKPDGVVWLIYSNRLSAAQGTAVATAATAAGFAPIKRLRYSAGYTAEKFVPRHSRH